MLKVYPIDVILCSHSGFSKSTIKHQKSGTMVLTKNKIKYFARARTCVCECVCSINLAP